MEAHIEVNEQQAKETLDMIQQATEKTQKSLASCDSSPWLLLWGGLWIAAYTTCHFYFQHAALIFTAMCIVGGIGSGIIGYWYSTRGPVKTDSRNPLGKKIFWFWFALFVYIAIWLAILSPFNGLQMNAMIVTGIMFAYVVMGLFYETPFLTIIGIFVTALTILTYYAFPTYYCLTLAIFGGGTLFGTGIYIRLKWR
ncbi:MAG: hypothetical protein ACYS72_04545 [Planctomycetota bacterium]|jgi:hypothetical protein